MRLIGSWGRRFLSVGGGRRGGGRGGGIGGVIDDVCMLDMGTSIMGFMGEDVHGRV